MVGKEYIFNFLRDLSNNNSKEWMDENRSRYETAKERWIEEVRLLLQRLSKHDSYFDGISPKSTLMRINNDIRFNPNKPIYKDYFTFSPMKKGEPIAKIHLSTGISWSFLGGGLYKPEKAELKKFRDAIDYDGDEFLEIINSKDFQGFFGGLSEDVDKLKTSPQGYPNDHEHIELLRYKSIIAQAKLTQKIVVSDGFVDYVEEAYLKLRPFTDYLIKVISVE